MNEEPRKTTMFQRRKRVLIGDCEENPQLLVIAKVEEDGCVLCQREYSLCIHSLCNTVCV